MVGGGDPFYLTFWVKPAISLPRCSEIADFQTILARSASVVTPSEKKVQLTLTESPPCAFQ